MDLSQGAKNLLVKYQSWYASLESKGDATTISVDEVAASVASFYEKIRGVVDWREEHLLRKTAIERILKRRVLFGGQTNELSESLLQELIRGGHFPNNRIQTTKIEEVQLIINKYLSLISQSKTFIPEKLQAKFEDWFLTLAACEIEESLSPRIREKALIDFMAHDMEKQIQLRKRDENKISQDDRMWEIYVGVQRALFKLDDATISLHVLEKFYPEWNRLPPDSVGGIASQILATENKIANLLHHPLAEKFYRIIEAHDTPYLLLGDIISEDPVNFERVAQNTSEFEEAIKNSYAMRLRRLKSRMNRAAFFSTISVFLSKVLIALAIEIPIDTKITHEFNQGALLWSIVIPPLFLLLLVKSVRFSTEENVQKILLEVAKITYETERKDRYEIAFPKKRNVAVDFILHFVYFLSFILSFGIIAVILKHYRFSTLSILVFLMFFSLVAFAGTRIRSRSRELIVGHPKEGFLQGLFDFFALPIVQVGRWLSGQIAKYNILVLLLNVLIETPFQVFVEFIEHLRTFWQEKKEEIH